ncbi:MAG: hypothetical protein PHR44_00830 [Candidatus Omnitrophica bacterium]|nr:hypothetical protein [Candidatus Omnitrophota bacterium]
MIPAKSKRLKRISLYILFSIIAWCLAIVLLDKLLAFNSWVYKKALLHRQYVKGAENKKYKFLFIGDSWVEGGEAPIGRGFPEQFIEGLKAGAFQGDYSYRKACWSSSNSSQAVLQFINEASRRDFEWVFVLTGANNGWNSEAVDRVSSFAYKAYGHEPLFLQEKDLGNLLAKIGLRRLARLASLYNYNKYIGSAKDENSQQGWSMIAKIEEELGSSDHSMDEVRESLAGQYIIAGDYNQFYHTIKLTFGNQHKPTEKFLRSRDLWEPELIKNLTGERMKDKILSIAWNVAERDLRLIAKLCRDWNIKLVFLTYPSNHASFDTVNNIIRKVADEEDAVLVDQDRLFEQQLPDSSDWEDKFARHHPNENGYALMADNLSSLFLDND